MTTHDDLAVAAGHSVEPGRWLGLLDELMVRIGSRFRRVEPRRRARGFVLGLLVGLPRMNCWTIAEQAGDATPDGMQHLLARAWWDVDGVRDDVRGYVIEHLGDPGAVLVADETGDLKMGTATAVHRHRRADRERPGRCLPRLRLGGRACADRPGAVPAAVLDRLAPPAAVPPGSPKVPGSRPSPSWPGG